MKLLGHIFTSIFALTIIFTSAWAAETPTAGTSSANESSFAEHLAVHYWGKYSGPSVGAFGDTTPDVFGNAGSQPQIIDDLLTVGYQATSALRPGIGIPFNVLPAKSAGVQLKPIYVGLVKARLIEAGDWIFDLDARAYLPVGDVAASQDVVTGFRTSQRVTYKIPSTRWTLGSYSYIRTWVYGNNGRGFRNDLEIYLSPFAHYRITSNLVATLWTDVLQLGHQLNSATGLSNLPMDIEPGVLWEITSKISVNPYLNFIPQSLSLNSTSIGMVINVAVL